MWWGHPCLNLYVAFRARRCFYFGIIIQTTKMQQQKIWPNYQSIYAHIYFILYHCVEVEMCDVPLWNILKNKVCFKIVYKCMFWMCSILTNKNKENTDKDINELPEIFIAFSLTSIFILDFQYPANVQWKCLKIYIIIYISSYIFKYIKSPINLFNSWVLRLN